MTGASANDDRLVRVLGGISGIRAIVRGGSRARDEATAQSDYDIGLYYEADNPTDIGRLYLLNEKGAVRDVERLARRPPDFVQRVGHAIGAGAAGLSKLSALVDETADLLKA